MRNLLTLFSIFFISAFAQDYSPSTHTYSKGDLHFQILYPKGFSEEKSYPLILFLHGAGERGSDNKSQLVHGASLFKDSIMKFPAIVVFPQCPENDYWAAVQIRRDENGKRIFNFDPDEPPTRAMEGVISLLDYMVAQPHIDESRIYVGGLSMGGMGTFDIVYRRPDMFAAAFPICGGGSPDHVERYARNTDFWVFHGARDDVVDPQLSQDMVQALQQAGGEVQFTLYPNANHNSWDSAFAEPQLLPWIFSKKKSNN